MLCHYATESYLWARRCRWDDIQNPEAVAEQQIRVLVDGVRACLEQPYLSVLEQATSRPPLGVREAEELIAEARRCQIIDDGLALALSHLTVLRAELPPQLQLMHHVALALLAAEHALSAPFS